MTLQTKNSLAGTASISAMDLRSNPGTILDRVDYKQESKLQVLNNGVYTGALNYANIFRSPVLAKGLDIS